MGWHPRRRRALVGASHGNRPLLRGSSIMPRTALSRTKRSPSERQRRTTLTPQSRLRPAYNAQLVSAVAAMSTLTLVFDRAVFVRGLTGITVDVGAVNTAPDTVVVTYDASVAAATTVTFPPYLGNLRTADGGFAAISTFPLPD